MLGWLLAAAGTCWAVELADSPSYQISFPRYRYPQIVTSIRKVDFRNLRTLLDGDYFVKLRNARHEKREKSEGMIIGFEDVALGKVDYFGSYAVVQIDWTFGGGSSNSYGIVQLCQVKSNHLEVLQLIKAVRPQEISFDPATRSLLVKATHYTEDDAHCCPSKLDIINFKWTGSEFALEDLKTVPMPEGQ